MLEITASAIMPFKSQAQRRFLYSQEPAVAKEFAAKTPKGAKLPEKVHPAVTQAMDSFHRLHGHKFAANAMKRSKKAP